MKALVIALALTAGIAHADTTVYKVKGMHCGACVQALDAKVCKMDGVEKCEVKMGQIAITPKTGLTITQDQVQAKMSEVGDDYKIVSSKTQK